jgi:2'-5' RNA ligase
MHITIRFLGEVPDDRADAITRALAGPLATPAFPVALGAPGLFPTRGAPRTFWIALDGDAAGAHRLEAEVSSRLEELGIPREARPFSPHLTLARVREAGGLRGTAVLAGLTVPPHAGGRVDAITLFESRLSSARPTYTALQRTPLR